MLMQDTKLIPATLQDIGTISGLADIIWHQHYPAIISMQQIRYMLDLIYSVSALREQMEIKGHLFFIVETAGTPVGFISVSKENGNDWFLHKFYINQEKAGKGIGAKAFELLKKTINPSKITLTVNRQNFKSINFYFKNGFKIERVADFDIGSGYIMDDFVMVWTNQ
jgi:RimJ/RimL family protein N-acetyltransferase